MAHQSDVLSRSAPSRVTNPARRRLLSATTLLLLPVIPQIAKASKLLAVRTWPASEYTRVTLELDSELKAEHEPGLERVGQKSKV